MRQVDLDWERGLAAQSENGEREGFVVTADGFLALLADGARNRVARYVRTGPDTWKRHWLTGEHAAHLFGLELAPDGKTLVYAQSTASTPTRWFRAGLDGSKLGKAEIVADLNEPLRKKTRPRRRSSAGRAPATRKWRASSTIRTATSRGRSIRYC